MNADKNPAGRQMRVVSVKDTFMGATHQEVTCWNGRPTTQGTGPERGGEKQWPMQEPKHPRI